MSTTSRGGFFTTLTNTLGSMGVSSSLIPSLLTSAATSTVTQKVDQLLNQLAVVSASPSAVANIVMQVEATPGVPSSVIGLLESLKAPGISQLDVFQTITAIEAAVAAANPVL